jgi:hypothetical protein
MQQTKQRIEREIDQKQKELDSEMKNIFKP